MEDTGHVVRVDWKTATMPRCPSCGGETSLTVDRSTGAMFQHCDGDSKGTAQSFRYLTTAALES